MYRHSLLASLAACAAVAFGALLRQRLRFSLNVLIYTFRSDARLFLALHPNTYPKNFPSSCSYNGSMNYYEVLVADSQYRGEGALTYSSELELARGSVVTVPLRNRRVTGFIWQKVGQPDFVAKPIVAIMSEAALPWHLLELAEWLSAYYATSLGEALRQMAPTKPTIRKAKTIELPVMPKKTATKPDIKLTKDQAAAIALIQKHDGTSLLHGDTGTGKTRVYIELARTVLANKQSVIILTPEIGLTGQLLANLAELAPHPIYMLHSALGVAQRKKTWLAILESKEPVVVIGPRSALFAPVQQLGLVVLDEAHEPTYKQEQSPRYQTSRVAAKLASLAKAKVVLGTATPLITDYYLAAAKQAVVRMTQPAVSSELSKPEVTVVDLKDSANHGRAPFLSKQLLADVTDTIGRQKQVLIYLNRRGSAQLIMCGNCGWQLLCPRCDLPLTYHGDKHQARCHTCGYQTTPPSSCPTCQSVDIIYKGVGTKTLEASLQRLFPEQVVARFDGDTDTAEALDKQHDRLQAGEIDIIVGTQMVAKGFDLPKLGLVGVIVAETSLFLPDYTADERTFQLLYQVLGRVGRGHTAGRAVIQTYHPDSPILKAALERDWDGFYERVLQERQTFRFPPFAHLLKLSCRRATLRGAQSAAAKLYDELVDQWGDKVQFIGPTPCFYERRAGAYYWQIVAKAKDRQLLVEIARNTPPNWMTDLDPLHLL